jgi:hypothetical protein
MLEGDQQICADLSEFRPEDRDSQGRGSCRAHESHHGYEDDVDRP